jgi:[histone H3]-lysine4 N-trimethyltransferase SETD1
MTRPPGASFAQFFPAAPRAARDRAVERDRERLKAQEPPSAPVADTNCHRTPSRRSPSRGDNDFSSGSGLTSKSHPNGLVTDAAPPPTDDTESLTGDTLNTVGSASSHASTSSSSLFSASAQQNAMAAVRNSNTDLTPLTSIDSPSANIPATGHTKAQSTTPLHSDGPNGFIHDNSPGLPSGIERVPARDTHRSIKCIKCTYDPLLDLKIPSAERRKAKPQYKEFGLVCTLNNPTLRGGVVFAVKHLANTCLHRPAKTTSPPRIPAFPREGS